MRMLTLLTQASKVISVARQRDIDMGILSVGLSVEFRYYVETIVHVIEISLPPERSVIPVF